MAKRLFGCCRPECSASMDVSGRPSFGTGVLDDYGFWEHGCNTCARAFEALHGEPCWPPPKSGAEWDYWPLARPDEAHGRALGEQRQYYMYESVLWDMRHNGTAFSSLCPDRNEQGSLKPWFFFPLKFAADGWLQGEHWIYVKTGGS